jgi:hypothetical protein
MVSKPEMPGFYIWVKVLNFFREVGSVKPN